MAKEIVLTEEEKKLTEHYKIFIGKKLQTIKHRVKAKNLVAFAELMGNKNPKYVGVKKEDGTTDYTGVVGHPCFPTVFSVGDRGAAFDVTDWRFPPKEGEEQGPKVIRNFGRLLHSGQEYDYSRAEVPIQHGQKLTVTGVMENAYIKSGMMWLVVRLFAHTQDEKLVVESVVTTVTRQGGWEQEW
ncbi:MAG: FAS1-like dehydratase domain-containing protein [Promethearchaeota archaeon]